MSDRSTLAFNQSNYQELDDLPKPPQSATNVASVQIPLSLGQSATLTQTSGPGHNQLLHNVHRHAHVDAAVDPLKSTVTKPGLNLLPSYQQMTNPTAHDTVLTQEPRNNDHSVKSSNHKPTEPFEIKNYQGLIANASLEHELIAAGYVPLSKVNVISREGNRSTQYIKALNLKGQTIFVYLDVDGYTMSRHNDFTLVESQAAQIVPYSLKTGAYNCANHEVCGIAFECGAEAVCILSHGEDDLTPRETNFVVKEPRVAGLESDEIMTYPVVKLSEIRENPEYILRNTDVVTRRLRNSAYNMSMQELTQTHQKITQLNQAFSNFTHIREEVANKLNSSLTQLEEWNEHYLRHPPTDQVSEKKYRAIQHNLTVRNEGIAKLLRLIKKVTMLKPDIERITQEMSEIAEFTQEEFVNIDKAYIS